MGRQLFSNLASDTPSLGVCISIPGPELVDCYGRAEWDVFYANMHSTRIDWSELAHMNLAARAWDITPCARIPMQPWVGGHNPALATDAHRAFSLGSSVVMASVHGPSEVGDLVELTRVEQERLGRELLVVPAIETTKALNQLAAILDVDGLRALFLGVSDLAQQLGFSGLEEPEMVQLVTTFVDQAHARGVAVAVNTGYAGERDDAWELTVRRSRWLSEIGADIVFAEPATEFMYGQVSRFVRDVRAPLAPAQPHPVPRPQGDQPFSRKR